MLLPTGNWHDGLRILIQLLIAYVLTGMIGWNREREEHTVGIRTFPIVGMSSCAYLLLVSGDAASLSRVMQGLIAGIGFIGGGAILKDGPSVKGSATAASIWNAAVIGAAVATERYEVAIILSLLNLFTLRVLLPLKNRLDRTNQQ